jgi:hypothetical protein
MEKELGLKRPIPKHRYRPKTTNKGGSRIPNGRRHKTAASYDGLRPKQPALHKPIQFIKPPKETPALTPYFAPIKPKKKGWPTAAVLDWELWGQRNPRRFFALWPELAL